MNIDKDSIIEKEHTYEFVSRLYYESRIKLIKEDIEDIEIWNKMKVKTIGNNVVQDYLNKLIENNSNRGFINYNIQSKKVFLTETGEGWGRNNYFRYPYDWIGSVCLRYSFFVIINGRD